MIYGFIYFLKMKSVTRLKLFQTFVWVLLPDREQLVLIFFDTKVLGETGTFTVTRVIAWLIVNLQKFNI